MGTFIFSLEASMAAMLAIPFKPLAAFSYSGARFLQCPHHGA